MISKGYGKDGKVGKKKNTIYTLRSKNDDLSGELYKWHFSFLADFAGNCLKFAGK